MRRLLAGTLLTVALLASGAGAAGAHPGGGDPAPPAGGRRGVVITPTGHVVPVQEAHSTGWIVTTVCANEAYLTAGTFVPAADVVLDPGHGGSESGSANGRVIEKNVNLLVALRAEQILEAEYGLSTQLTRTQDVRVPLRVRGAIAEALKPRAFVSIHHNGGATARRNSPGTEVFHQIDSPESRRLGGILYEELVAELSKFPTQWVGSARAGVSSRIRSDGTDLYGVLRTSRSVPGVITEALWLSNPAEARLLANWTVLDAEARAIARGIVRFLTTKDPGSGFKPPVVDETTTGTGGVEGCRDPELGTPPATVYTGYTADEIAGMEWAARQLGMDLLTFQKTGVFVVDFLRGLAGRPFEPLAEEPWVHGPIVLTGTWPATERPVLERSVHGYDVGPQQVQKVGAYLLTYLTGLAHG